MDDLTKSKSKDNNKQQTLSSRSRDGRENNNRERVLSNGR
jgi:hypothetical protein